MKIHRPSELQAFLRELGIDAKPGLSQNFLIDGNILRKIVKTASVHPGDLVLEIGPGPGALTETLLEAGASVLAVEMDATFAQTLSRLQTPDHRLKVIHADVLTFPLLSFLQKQTKKYKVIANLPYHITTPILTLLLPLHSWIDTLTLMVQKEFADRMVAQPSTKDYSSFTVFLQFYAKVTERFTVSPHCFFPEPSVFSSVVHCKLHPPLLEKESDSFFLLTRTAFGQRRKMLRSTLGELYGKEQVEKALIDIGHPSTERPENLSIEEFISLYEIVSNK